VNVRARKKKGKRENLKEMSKRPGKEWRDKENDRERMISGNQ
jgi:hypothetical protein